MCDFNPDTSKSLFYLQNASEKIHPQNSEGIAPKKFGLSIYMTYLEIKSQLLFAVIFIPNKIRSI